MALSLRDAFLRLLICGVIAAGLSRYMCVLSSHILDYFRSVNADTPCLFSLPLHDVLKRFLQTLDTRMFGSRTRVEWPLEVWPQFSSINVYHSLESFSFSSIEQQIFLLAIGFVNAVVLAMFFSDVLLHVLPDRLRSLDALPFLFALADTSENALLIVILYQYPSRSVLAAVIGYITVFKWALALVVLTLSFVGAMTLPCRRRVGGSGTIADKPRKSKDE